jgi:carbon-monoxide dehydrogenase iron sulfur subunit
MGNTLSNDRKFISVDIDKCIGCGICEYACALEKEGFPDPSKSRIRVIRLNPWINVALACRFCEDAWCVKACPKEALKQSEKGVPLVDADKCSACGWCLQACPYGGIVLHPEKRVVTCDLCDGNPKCIDFCPEEALQLTQCDEIAEKMWVLAVERLPEKVERFTRIIKKKDWAELFIEAEEKAKRIEEKLEALSKRIMKA